MCRVMKDTCKENKLMFNSNKKLKGLWYIACTTIIIWNICASFLCSSFKWRWAQYLISDMFHLRYSVVEFWMVVKCVKIRKIKCIPDSLFIQLAEYWLSSQYHNNTSIDSTLFHSFSYIKKKLLVFFKLNFFSIMILQQIS